MSLLHLDLRIYTLSLEASGCVASFHLLSASVATNTVKMVLPQLYILFHLVLSPFSTAQRVLPVAPDAEIQSAAFLELYEVMISPQEGLQKRRAVPHPRKHYAANPPGDYLYIDSSPAMIKRTLLGERQSTCDPGYSLCRRSSFRLTAYLLGNLLICVSDRIWTLLP